jgi:hypothetical protein
MSCRLFVPTWSDTPSHSIALVVAQVEAEAADDRREAFSVGRENLYVEGLAIFGSYLEWSHARFCGLKSDERANHEFVESARVCARSNPGVPGLDAVLHADG